MKILIIYRGFHYKQGDGSDTGLIVKNRLNNGMPFHLSMVAENHRRMIFDPLREMGEVRIAGCTYPSPEQDQLVTELQHEMVHYVQAEGSSQISTMNEVLRLMQRYRTEMEYDFDWLLILRYDLIYKIPIGGWNIPWTNLQAPVQVPFLMKQPKLSKRSKRHYILVSDCIFCVSRSAISDFICQCFSSGYYNDPDFHQFVIPFNAMMPDILYDNNTSIQQNPLYIMAGRPLASI
jgi:hypothetical protein